MPDPRVKLSYDGPVAVITNDNPDKKNAFDDEMDLALFEILTELKANKAVRAIVWRGEGSAWSSGRDVGAIGGGQVGASTSRSSSSSWAYSVIRKYHCVRSRLVTSAPQRSHMPCTTCSLASTVWSLGHQLTGAFLR